MIQVHQTKKIRHKTLSDVQLLVSYGVVDVEERLEGYEEWEKGEKRCEETSIH